MKKEFINIFQRILGNTKDLIIAIPNCKKLNVVNMLKKLPREGLRIRLNVFDENIKVRTIYDHINSLANIADLLFEKEIISVNKENLAILIVYHDLCEAIIGDFPSYTEFYEPTNRELLNVHNVDKELREDIANNFLWMYANPFQKECLKKIKERNDDTYEIFKILDYIDPIINVWRYIYNYNEIIAKNPDMFFEIMIDFFRNPILESIANECKYENISNFVGYLKNVNNAKEYLLNIENSESIIPKNIIEIFSNLVEKQKIFY